MSQSIDRLTAAVAGDDGGRHKIANAEASRTFQNSEQVAVFYRT